VIRVELSSGDIEAIEFGRLDLDGGGRRVMARLFVDGELLITTHMTNEEAGATIDALNDARRPTARCEARCEAGVRCERSAHARSDAEDYHRHGAAISCCAHGWAL
jgi:hypothetical protein